MTVPAQNDITHTPATLVAATEQYKASSKELLSIQEAELNKATAKLEELRALVAEGLVAKSELETNGQALADLRTQLQATQKQIADADHMIAEIQAEQELAKTRTAMASNSNVKLVSKQYGALNSAAAIIRNSGVGGWSVAGLNQIQTFYSASFGHLLPTSAVGQSATHNLLGYDHRNAVDVALNPNSAEGRALMNYLQMQGIPFLAFRTAIPGVATGPHIHIGTPSHRLS